MIAKVCGLTTEADLNVALGCGADFLGFLHHPPSPRHCRDLNLERLAGDRSLVVMVENDDSIILETVISIGVHWTQPYLPAEKRADAVKRLRQAGLNVLLPWPDEPGQDAISADLYLWESSPKSTGLLGGSGQGHSMLHPPPGPFLLAGGLDGDNLRQRYEALPTRLRWRCWGFDAASRLESAPGRKDLASVAHFVRTAHSLEFP